MWRVEAGGRNGGTGVGSSAEESGTKDIAGDGFGRVVDSEERSMSGNCGRIVGTEDCRVVVVEDCRTGGEFNFDDKTHMQLCLMQLSMCVACMIH